MNETRSASAWHVLPSDWRRSSAAACACCGRPLFGQVWRAEVTGQTRDFCDPRCEALFVDYWLPRHGHALRGKG